MAEMVRMSIRRKKTQEKYHTIHVKPPVYEALMELQAWLQLKEYKRFSHSDIIQYALSRLPELVLPLPDRIRIIFEENEARETEQVAR